MGIRNKESWILNSILAVKTIKTLARYPQMPSTIRFNIGYSSMRPIYLLLNQLEGWGYVKKSKSANHKQAYLWELTPKGEALYLRYLKGGKQ